MYLVHVHMRRPADGGPVPEEIGTWVGDMAPPGHIDHISVHARTPDHPVLGVYLLADHLEEAEELALTACRRVLAHRPELRGWQVIEGYVPLLAPFYDTFTDSSALSHDAPLPGCAAVVVDTTVHGRFRPYGGPSPRPEPGES
ncbi:hypothetical protein [Streptomyces hydrogenans]|uniref:hypothetical protein n=1 Tax=Streptomyces hydrogenans TaxID=1873719 RepID=UPI0035DB0FDF